mmetsp:Transcript_17534/g.48844  ORF Transcript_17534/g.48844 Transcript_17534/m.48844 type:complete len:267 (+) Transcript_17534:4115-4915(+)
MENVPSLFSFMTAGIEGKMRQASSFSRAGPTTEVIFSASSSMKIREPMKMLAASTSFLKDSMLLASRSSSSRYPTTSKQTLSFLALMFFTALDRADWYWASSTTYTTFTHTRLPWFSGTTRRNWGLVLVNRPELSEPSSRMSTFTACFLKEVGMGRSGLWTWTTWRCPSWRVGACWLGATLRPVSWLPAVRLPATLPGRVFIIFSSTAFTREPSLSTHSTQIRFSLREPLRKSALISQSERMRPSSATRSQLRKMSCLKKSRNCRS